MRNAFRFTGWTNCLVKARKGQGMTEYAVVIALVVAIAITVLASNGTLGNAIKNVFTSIAGKMGNI